MTLVAPAAGGDIRAVVFDLDGTLYRTGRWFIPLFLWHNRRHPFLFRAHRRAMREMRGEDFGSGELFRDELARKTAAYVGVPPENARRWYREHFYSSFVDLLATHCTARPGTYDLLVFLRNRPVKTAVFSDYGMIPERLRALSLDSGMVDLCVSGEDAGVLKPGVRVLRQVLDTFGVHPEETVCVGDRDDTDGACARRTGSHFIHVEKNGPRSLRDIMNKSAPELFLNS